MIRPPKDHHANNGPNTNFDASNFEKILCYVGRDIAYSKSALITLLEKKTYIAAIVGENSIEVWNEIPCNLKTYEIELIPLKRPWESSKFESFFLFNKLLGVNCGFDYIIPGNILYNIPTLNIHPAALPFNRGCHHSFWAIMDSTNLGATLHWMSEGLDEGPIIAQKTFTDDGFSTAKVLQEKCNSMCLDLLRENIDLVMNGLITSTPQGIGTYHSKKDIIKKSILNAQDIISVNYLFDLCRATNSKGNGFFVIKNNRKFKIIIDRIEEVDGK
jgi:methionyl-tRNA formyltransferase